MWQGAGISSGGKKIGVTGAETGGETEIEHGSNNYEPSEDVQSCGGVCAVSGFRSSTGRPRSRAHENHNRARRVTLNVTQLIASGFQLSAFVEIGSAADVSLLRIANAWAI